MFVLKLSRSLTPLHTSTIVELFQRLGPCLRNIRYEERSALRPEVGDLYIVDGLEASVLDGYLYNGGMERFNEAEFDVVIERTRESPSLIKFTYYNRACKYRLIHYLLYDPRAEPGGGAQRDARPLHAAGARAPGPGAAPGCQKTAPCPAEERLPTYYCGISEEIRERYAFIKDLLFPRKTEELDDLEAIDAEYWQRRFADLLANEDRTNSFG